MRHQEHIEMSGVYDIVYEAFSMVHYNAILANDFALFTVFL